MILAPRHLPRLTATIGLFTRFGLASFAKEQGLDTLPRDEADDAPRDDEPSPEKAAAFRARLVELGPAYVKLGQLLASRPDLMPDAYIRELKTLEDAVEPITFGQVAEIVESELGGRLSKLFATFDEAPLGAASLGQAHAATLRDSREVVVKVQRPHIRAQLADDISFFRELAAFFTAHSSVGKRIDLIGIIAQLEGALADELDYRIEARNAAHFRRALAGFPRLLAPRVIGTYSTERVLTTERIRGIKFDEIPPITRVEVDFHPVADELMRAYLKQIAIDGHFHADPHPGNVFVLLPAMDNPPTPSEIVSFGIDEIPDSDSTTKAIVREEREARDEAPLEFEPVEVKLALIDFGMTARLSPAMRESCVRVLLGLADGKGEDVADALMEMGEKLPDFDRVRFVNELSAVVSKAYRMNAGDLDAGGVLYELIDAAFQNGLRPPSELTLLAKALAHLGVISRALDPGFEPLETVRSYMSEIASDRAKDHMNPRHLYKVVNESAELLGALPHRLDIISKRLANNEFQTRFDFPQITVLLEGLQKVANRVFTGLVLAGLLVASAMLLPERRILGTAGFVIAAALGLYMVISILMSDRRNTQRTS